MLTSCVIKLCMLLNINFLYQAAPVTQPDINLIIFMLTIIARSLFKTLDNIATPCSVNAIGK